MYTVNVVIFAGEKICENVGKKFMLDNFDDTTPISFIKAYVIYFSMG